MNDRRVENRFACADMVRVNWLEEDTFRATEAVLEDISRVGACVQVEDEVPLGAAIIITLGETQFRGTVSYCVFRDYGYFVGVRFREDTVWRSGDAAPAHLTDLSSIANTLT